jgi:hypothetical protein
MHDDKWLCHISSGVMKSVYMTEIAGDSGPCGPTPNRAKYIAPGQSFSAGIFRMSKNKAGPKLGLAIGYYRFDR